MAISTYAAIDVGSSELSMKIYEVSKQNGIRELTMSATSCHSAQKPIRRDLFLIRQSKK